MNLISQSSHHFTSNSLPLFLSPLSITTIDDSVIEYINTELPPEAPTLFGLHPNAEIGYLETTTQSLFQTILNISGGGGGGGGDGGGVVREVLDGLQEQLPVSFIMLIVYETAAEPIKGPHSPYVVVAIQECGRMVSSRNSSIAIGVFSATFWDGLVDTSCHPPWHSNVYCS